MLTFAFSCHTHSHGTLCHTHTHTHTHTPTQQQMSLAMYDNIKHLSNYKTTNYYNGAHGGTRLTLTMRYGTTNSETSAGGDPRHIYIIRPEKVSETEYGAAGDDTPGWWAWHDGRQKFFVTQRIRTVEVANQDDALYLVGDVPAVGDGPAALRNRSPDSSPERDSRSRSRSPDSSRSPRQDF
jgi:hypothetical protein